MQKPHEPIMYPRNIITRVNDTPHQYFFKAGSTEMNKNQEYSNFFHTYCDADHARDLYDRRSVTSIYHPFKGTVIDCCTKKQSKTSRHRSNAETRAIYIGMLYKNWIVFKNRSLVTP